MNDYELSLWKHKLLERVNGRLKAGRMAEATAKRPRDRAIVAKAMATRRRHAAELKAAGPEWNRVAHEAHELRRHAYWRESRALARALAEINPEVFG